MRVMVTGGGGFLGGEIVRQLLERGDEVGSLTRSDQPELRALGVDVRRGDISVLEDAKRGLDGYEHVIHTAAMVSPWGALDAFYRTNVGGTKALLAASEAVGVRRFVFSSSPSAIFDGKDLVDAPADVPYPASFPSPYGDTKAQSERLVRAAHDVRGVQTVSLRPQLIWGPGDPHLLPMMIEKARAGKLRQGGRGDVKVDLTFVENAALAHVSALDALGKAPDDATYPGGKVYFISNDEPVELWSFLRRMLSSVGEPEPKGSVPRGVALALGSACDVAWKVLGRSDEPPISRFVVLKMCTHQWYDMEPARRDLGYAPRVSMEEGLSRWAAHVLAERAGR